MRFWALLGQYPKIISAKRSVLGTSEACLSQIRADGTLLHIFAFGPIQAVMFALVAVEFLGVLRGAGYAGGLGVKIVFGIHQIVQRIDGLQFILANSPVQNFLSAKIGIEIPFVTSLHKRNGHGPVLRPYI